MPRRRREYYVDILSNYSGTLYVGITNDLERRILEHRSKQTEGFTRRYNVTSLLYYEPFEDVQEAIDWEKRIKSWRRSKKLNLVKEHNPEWRNLARDLVPD